MVRMTERITDEQEARLVRAQAEGSEYTWTKSPAGWVVTTSAGKAYQVTETACSCGDFQHRCAGTLLVCKHVAALRLRLLTQPATTAPTVAADGAARRAARASIFEEA